MIYHLPPTSVFPKTMPLPAVGPEIAIIGSGPGGLTFAIALKQQLGYNNFTIFEKANSVGGTWRDNIYPGCSSDNNIHFYSLSTDLKPDWNTTHAFQPEIEEYWQKLSEKYSLLPHLVFGCEVVAANWDSLAQVYHITTKDVKTGALSLTTARILVSAVGLLAVPKFPDIPGLADFRGTMFHSARWVDTELDGKRVAVIGNGASATQFLPIISQRPNIRVTQFCRTPNWLFPPLRASFSSWQIWAFKYLPFFLRSYRFSSYLELETLYFAVWLGTKFTRSMFETHMKNHMLKHAPAKYHPQLIPNYPAGCKRLLIDSDYLSALHQDNVTMNWEGISSIVPDGIISRTGEHLAFDVIIAASGFVTGSYPLTIRGTKQTLQEYYEKEGGPMAYLGTSTPDFPNFFTLNGANTASGHMPFFFVHEVQSNYIIKLIKPIIEGRISSVDVTTSATDAYNTKIKSRISRSVFMNCLSWYRASPSGIPNIFPGAMFLFWWWLLWPTWNHYRVIGEQTPLLS